MIPFRINVIPGDWPNLERQLNKLTRWIASQPLTAVSSPEFGGLTINTMDELLKATDGVVGEAAAGTDYEVPLTFSSSLLRTINDIALVADDAAPGNDYYYGTGPTGDKGFFTISSGSGIGGLTANRLVATDGTPALASVANLASWIAGTSNQVTVTDDTDGTITLSLPQDIHTGASPTFASLNLTGQVLLKGLAGVLYVRDITDSSDTEFSASVWHIGTQLAVNNTSFQSNAQNYTISTGDRVDGQGYSLNLTAGKYDAQIPFFPQQKGGNIILTSGLSEDGAGGDISLITGVGTTTNGNIVLNSLTGLLLGTAGVVSAITDNSANWDTAYTDRLKWDGGATGLVVATGRTSLGLGVADTPSFTGLISGVDAATNTAGSLKLWSAGANNYSTLFTAGTQTADATYTLPTAMPPSTSQFLQCTTGGVLSWETVSTAPDALDAVLNAGDTSASHNLTLTVGTLTAEQLTSTDDVTMVGKFLNTMAADDKQGIWIDGDTNALSYSSVFTTHQNLISRTINGSGSTALPVLAVGALLKKSYIWNYDFSGTAQNSGVRVLTLDYADFTIGGDINITGNGTPGVITPVLTFVASKAFVTCLGGTITENSTKNSTFSFYGAQYVASFLDTLAITGTGTKTFNVYGGAFTSTGGPTISTGDAVINTYGGYFAGVGSAAGTSTVYGGYFSGTGGDTNYDLYAPNTGSYNILAGNTRIGSTVSPTVALDVVGAILASTTITATTDSIAAYHQTSTAITANSTGTVAIVAKDANLLTANAGWMPIKKSDGTIVYIPYWA
jgi:hypothetical protein